MTDDEPAFPPLTLEEVVRRAWQWYSRPRKQHSEDFKMSGKEAVLIRGVLDDVKRGYVRRLLTKEEQDRRGTTDMWETRDATDEDRLAALREVWNDLERRGDKAPKALKAWVGEAIWKEDWRTKHAGDVERR